MKSSILKFIGIVTVTGVLALGCDSVVDVDAELAESKVKSQSLIASNTTNSTVLVTENNVGDDWIANVVGDDSGYSFTEDFEAPNGFGNAALLLFTGEENQDRAELGTEVNVRLDNVGSLEYYTFQPPGNPALAAVAYKLYVTFEDGWTFLVYEPYWQNDLGNPAPVLPNEWQQWTDMEDGNWWSSRSSGGLEAGFGGPPFYSLDDVLKLHPDAVVEFIQLGIGSFNPEWSVLADGMTFAGITYDFDIVQDPLEIADCQDGGWADYGFSNQGQCIRFVNTGEDSR